MFGSEPEKDRRSQPSTPHAEPGTRAVVLDAETVPFIDVTAATMLAELAESLHDRGVAFVIAGEMGQVRDVLRATGSELAPTYPTVPDAVAALGER